MERKKLAIVSTHPIQYNAPLFALLEQSQVIQPRVFYTWSQGEEAVPDRDFKQTIRWDIPLLEGYDHEFSKNTSKNPGLHHFMGLKNPGLIKQISNWNPDGILVYGWNFYSHLSVMRYFKGRKPVFFRGDSTLLDEASGMKTLIRRKFLRWVYSHVDAAFYVGTNNKDYFNVHGLHENKLYFAPHAIDNDRFELSSRQKENEAAEFRSRLGIDTTQTVVLFAGKFEPKKDPALLIKAFAAMNSRNKHLVLVGNGPQENMLKALAEGQKNIHFLPFQNQSKMPAIYGMADLLALPSQGPGETWGLAVNEAMACGKPALVSTKVGCSADLVKPGLNGDVFEAGNLESLTRSLDSLTRSKNNLGQMGQNAKSFIHQWSFSAIKKSFEENCFAS